MLYPRNSSVCFLGVWLWLISTLLAASVSATQLTARDYGALPSRQLLTISPNGEKIAFRSVEDGNDLVMVYSLKERQVITGADVSGIMPRDLYFVNDQYLIMVVSEFKSLRQFRSGFDMSTAYSLDTRTGEIQQLLRPGDNIYLGQAGLGRISGLSQDHRFAYMPAYTGSASNNPRYGLMRVDFASPRRPREHHRGHMDAIDFFVSPEGSVLAEERFNNRSKIHRILVPDGRRNWREIYTEETDIPLISVSGISQNLESLVVVTMNEETGRQDYYTMSLADGSLAGMNLGRSDADVESLVVDLNRTVYGLRYSGFRPSYQLFDVQQQSRVDSVQKLFDGHSVWLAGWSHDWRHLLFYVEGSMSSGDYYLLSEDKAIMHLMSARPNIPDDSIHPVVVFNYQARDGLSIPALLTVPRQRAESPRKLPAIVMPHGGPAAYDKLHFDWLAQAFAEHGYLVVQPQFRGSTGFGVAHYLAGRGEWGRKMQSDLTDAVSVLANQGLLDTSRVCIVGASYGGYAALAGAAFTPDIYQCAVSINGVSDIEELFKHESRLQRSNRHHWALDYFRKNIGGEDGSREHIRSISPANHAGQVKVPVLLIHGENDEVVPLEQSEIMDRQLRRAKKSVEFVLLKEDNHNLMQGDTRIEAMERILKFVDQHLTEVVE